MIVEVTQEHINRGFVDSLDSCPIGLAMQENGFGNVQVTDWCICCDHQPTPLQLHITPDFSVVHWMYDFDGGREVFPIQINIDKEEQYATLVE